MYISLTKKKINKSNVVYNKLNKKSKKKKTRQHPIRSRILNILGEGVPRSQQEIAKILTMSNAAVHYHVKTLLATKLIKLHSKRDGPNSIVEKLYIAIPESDINTKPEDEVYSNLEYIISWIKERHREGKSILQSNDFYMPILAGSYSLSVPEKEIVRFKRKMEKTAKEFFEKYKDNNNNSDPKVSISFSILPSNENNVKESLNVIEYEPAL